MLAAAASVSARSAPGWDGSAAEAGCAGSVLSDVGRINAMPP